VPFFICWLNDVWAPSSFFPNPCSSRSSTAAAPYCCSLPLPLFSLLYLSMSERAHQELLRPLHLQPRAPAQAALDAPAPRREALTEPLPADRTQRAPARATPCDPAQARSARTAVATTRAPEAEPQRQFRRSFILRAIIGALPFLLRFLSPSLPCNRRRH
jgi:hypothetical protein